MASYDSLLHKPPAPIALVTFISIDKGTKANNIPMLLDTGADGSVVPASVVQQLAAPISADRGLEIEGYDGVKSVVQLAMIEMDFGEEIFTGEFIVLDQPIGIIGRNVLNRFNINFNGPKLAWDIVPSSA